MRFVAPGLGFVCVVAIAWASSSHVGLGQQPAPPPTAPDQRLDLVLKYWEQVMSSVQALEANCERTVTDKVFKTQETYKGVARFLKSTVPTQPSRASLELRSVANPNLVEKLILTGNYLYEYAPASKEVRIHDIPPPRPGESADHNLMGLLFGMKVVDAKQRYQIALKSEDANYFYLEIEPRTDRDKNDFAKARLALMRSTYLPRQLWFQQANGNVVLWDLPAIEPNAKLRATDFQPPATPSGWKTTRVPAATPTKVRGAN